MRVRDWTDILNDVVNSDVEPTEWRAVAGQRDQGVGEDLYLAHPGVGVFQLKTYTKNPYEVKGVGSKIARSVDEDLQPLFPEEQDQRFAVQTPPESEQEAEQIASRVETVIETHARAPTSSDALFDDVMDALESPAYGPLEFDLRNRPEPLDELATTFEEAESLLDTELTDVIEEDGVGRGFQ